MEWDEEFVNWFVEFQTAEKEGVIQNDRTHWGHDDYMIMADKCEDAGLSGAAEFLRIVGEVRRKSLTLVRVDG